jgi:hypothetical protein
MTTSRDADPDEATRAAELERILTAVQERVRIVLSGYVRGGWPLQRDDIDEIVGSVTVRVLRKLRAATVLEEERVQNVVTLPVTPGGAAVEIRRGGADCGEAAVGAGRVRSVQRAIVRPYWTPLRNATTCSALMDVVLLSTGSR